MSEGKQSEDHHAPIWGIFLLFLGIIFLLQSLNFLPWGLWESLWRFWPVLIIIIGLGILLSRSNVWLVSLLILALLFACLGIAIWQYDSPSPLGQTTEVVIRGFNYYHLYRYTDGYTGLNELRS